MKVEIRVATTDDETAFRNLFQFYIYEFSRFTGWHTTSGGRFIEDDLEGCWTTSTRHPYLIKVDSTLAGLAIISQQSHSRYSAATDITSMSEFFIMAAFQKRGIGQQSAHRLFDLYPGKWEVYQMKANLNAQHFWRKTIGRYTPNYKEIFHKEENGYVQFFDNSSIGQ